MRPRRRSPGAGSPRLSGDASSGVTLFASGSYVTRSEALALHLGQRELDRPAHFLVPLRRALARIAPGAFDSPPRHPWRVAERRGGAFRLDVGEAGHAELEAAVEAASTLNLSVFEATTGETSQPMRLDQEDLLTDALSDLDDDGYLILEGGSDYDIYVQALGEGRKQVQLEAVSKHHLPPDLARTLPRVDALEALGFRSPTDEESANLVAILPRTTRVERSHAAARLVRALHEGYDVALTETFRLRCSAPEGFTPEELLDDPAR
ncbi:MAG: hypothetical protein AAGF92_01655 [Myxococcota bacterium]